MRYKKHVAGDDGWSEWIMPVHDGYKMACCDCGLVHTLEFEVIHQIEPRVLFRCRRNERATAQMRRHDMKRYVG